MTTTTLHADVQRSRFAQHTLSALAGLIPPSLRPLLFPVARPDAITTRAIEARRVRTLAASYAKTDPGFASDLYAAAARHDGVNAD